LAEEAESEAGVGGDGFDGGLDVLIVGEAEEEGEEGVAKEHESADDAGIARAGLVFEEQGILAPVETVFDAGAVSADEGAPRGEGAFVGVKAAEVEAGFERVGAGLLEVTGGEDDDDRAGVRYARAEGIDGNDAQGTDFDASVGALRLGKKGG
jgi:hypothetical protein